MVVGKEEGQAGADVKEHEYQVERAHAEHGCGTQKLGLQVRTGSMRSGHSGGAAAIRLSNLLSLPHFGGVRTALSTGFMPVAREGPISSAHVQGTKNSGFSSLLFLN